MAIFNNRGTTLRLKYNNIFSFSPKLKKGKCFLNYYGKRVEFTNAVNTTICIKIGLIFTFPAYPV